MKLAIQVDIEELIDKLTSMLEDDFATVELTINDSAYLSEYVLGLKAINVAELEDTDYGILNSVQDYF